MAISLVTPIGANFLKDFPGQNAVDQNLIDTYAGPCLTTHALQTWTPSLFGASSDPVLGVASYQKGYYYRLFDQIFAWGEFRFGTSGASFGSGAYLMNLPFPARTNLGFNATLGQAPIIGNGVTWDQSASNGIPLIVQLRTSTQVEFGIRMGSGLTRDVNPSTPMVWAVQDGITFAVRYTREVS